MHYGTFKLSFEDLDEPPRWLMEIAEEEKLTDADKNSRRGCAQGVLMDRMDSHMETAPEPSAPAWLQPLRRYVPLVVWGIVFLTLLLIPLKIMQYGFLPGDDALRSAGKAVSGKTWPEVLVLSDFYKIDHEYGWSRRWARSMRGLTPMRMELSSSPW